jgi:glycine/D-amino acid oxidase-like deaminating enzyme
MSTLPAAAESYWMDSTEATSYPPLVEAAEVDVAVVGGGVAGICAAWELMTEGRSVAVLEADRVAAGVTGYTTAKLSSLHTLKYAHLRDSQGADAARLYAQSQQDAIEHVARTSTELGIHCELERVPAFTYVRSRDLLDEVRAEAGAASEAGLQASFVTEASLPFPVAGAVRVADQAQFHPRRYLVGLAREMTRRGARIHEHTRVTGLHEGEPCRLTTETGATVTARDVVVATHYPIFDRALLFTRLKPHRELVVAAAIPADCDPRGMYITPEQNVRSVRTAPYDAGQRLLIVTGEAFAPGTGGVAERFERLARWTREQFGVHEFAYRWAAPGQRHDRRRALRRPPPSRRQARLRRLRRNGLRRLGHEQRRYVRTAPGVAHRRQGGPMGQALPPPTPAARGRTAAQAAGDGRQALRPVTGCARPTSTPSTKSRRGLDPSRASAVSVAPSTATRAVPTTPCPRAAPT